MERCVIVFIWANVHRMFFVQCLWPCRELKMYEIYV